MSVKLTRIEIGGANVTSEIRTWELEDTYANNTDQITLTGTMALTGLTTLETGKTLVVYEGYTTPTDTKVFSGYITSIEKDGKLIRLVGLDKMWLAIKQEVTKIYESQKVSDIFKDLCTLSGLTADGTSVQDSGASSVLYRFVCNHTDPFERMMELANVLNWQFYYNPATDKVYFEPKGFILNPNTITVAGTGNDVVEVPKWTEDLSNLVNAVIMIGAVQLVRKTELFSGNGSNKDFTITKTPENVWVRISGVEKLGGMPGSTGTYDYYVVRENKRISFVVAPVTGTNNVEIIFDWAVPTPVYKDVEASKTKYGLSQKTIYLGDTTTVADAEVRAGQMLSNYAYPFNTTCLVMKPSSFRTLGIAIGNKIRVTDTKNSINTLFVVKKIKKFFPEKPPEIEITDKELRYSSLDVDVQQRLKRLEEKEIQNQDILLVVKSLPHQATFKRKSITVQTQDVSGIYLYDTTRTYDGTATYDSTPPGFITVYSKVY